MRRQSLLALGLLALVVALGNVARPICAADVAKDAAAQQGHPASASSEGGDVATDHEGTGEPNILQPEPSLAIWTVVVFIGLLLVLGRFAWRPLLQALHKREEHLEHCLLETE